MSRPKVMGIVNLTPDSFYARHPDHLMETVEDMLEAGADFIDLGGQSTRPGATLLTAEEELQRVLPCIQQITQHFPGAMVSIDTFYAHVAKAAVEHGAAMVNDVSGGDLDPTLFETISRLNVPYILMHHNGIPAGGKEMEVHEDVIQTVMYSLSKKLSLLRALGIKDIILDPGFGFGKNVQQNYKILEELNSIALLGCPVLVGISRKKMIQQVVGTDAGGALNGTTAAHMIALINGASVLRVHDVKEAVETIRIYERVFPAG